MKYGKVKWDKVGEIGVDAGLCWVGDPCYVVAGNRWGGKWANFVEELFEIEKNGAAAFPYDLGHEGLGVAVSTGYGDGSYPVYVRRDEQGRVMEVRVVFDEGRDELDRIKGTVPEEGLE